MSILEKIFPRRKKELENLEAKADYAEQLAVKTHAILMALLDYYYLTYEKKNEEIKVRRKV